MSEPLRDPDDRRRRRGARSIGEGGRRRRGGLLWLLLGLLALAIALAVILPLVLGGDDDDRTAQQREGQTQQQPAAQDDQAPAGQGGAGGGGRLTADGTSILPPPSGGLGQYVGQTGEGQGVRVQSVVQNQDDPNALEGFWVGSSATERVYVEYGGDVGEDEAEFIPRVGETVDLTGPVRPAPEDPEQALNLDAEDAELVSSQGAYVNADSVTRTSG